MARDLGLDDEGSLHCSIVSEGLHGDVSTVGGGDGSTVPWGSTTADLAYCSQERKSKMPSLRSSPALARSVLIVGCDPLGSPTRGWDGTVARR